MPPYEEINVEEQGTLGDVALGLQSFTRWQDTVWGCTIWISMHTQ